MTVKVLYFRDYRQSINPNVYNIFFIKSQGCGPCRATYNFLFADKNKFYSLISSNPSIQAVMRHPTVASLEVNVIIVELDQDHNFEVDRYSVRYIPSWIVTKNNGDQISNVTGAVLTDDQFVQKFTSFLGFIVVEHAKNH